VDPALSTVTAAAGAVAGGDLAVAIKLVDAFANPIPARRVGLSFGGAAAAGAFSVAEPTGAGGGVALGVHCTAAGRLEIHAADTRAAATLVSTKSGALRVAATIGGALLGVADVSFAAGPASAAKSKLVADKSSARADGAASIGLTATVADANGNPIAGKAVAL